MVYLFKDSDNPIDNLIDQLTKAGWTTKLASSGYFTKYKWPNIVFSGDRIRYFDLPFDWETETHKEVEDKRNDDFENEIDEDNYTHDEKEFRNCIELMGCYRFKCNNQYKEGEVVIYYEKIYRVALNYCSNHKKWKGVELEHSINFLRDIIMYHEFIHWLMHWVKSTSGRYIPHVYNSRDTVMFHEAFAQLFTHLYVQNNDGRKEIFDWLLSKQPPQYLAHDNLLKAGVDSIEKAIILLELLRKNGIQGYKATLDLLSSPCYKSSSGSIINIMEGFEEWISAGNGANTFIDDFISTKFTPSFKSI
jgi:hypothetical protein